MSYTISTNDYADGGVMVEVLPDGADATLPNYGAVRRFKAANGASLYGWSLYSGQHGVEASQDAAISQAARAIWEAKP